MMTTKENLSSSVIQKAWADEQFKQRLMEDPKTAVKEAFGVDIPDDFNITVVEETSTHFYLVIPPNPSSLQNDPSVYIDRW